MLDVGCFPLVRPFNARDRVSGKSHPDFLMHSAVTISLVPEARGGPFVFWGDLAAGCARAAELGFDAVEIFPTGAGALDVASVHKLLGAHGLKLAAIGTGAGWVKHRLRLTDPDVKVRQKAIEFSGEIID